MGPKFVIVFSGVDIDAVTNFISDVKHEIEQMQISIQEKNIEEIELEQIDKTKNKNKKKENSSVTPKLNFVLTRYYKGTGMEEVLKKLEQYIDNADKSENDITSI